MSRSGQLGQCCTVEPNCSIISARLAGASVTRDLALETCELSYVPGVARPFSVPMVHSPLGAVGYVVAPELSSRGDRAQSHRTHGSAGAHLGREVRSEAEEHVAAPELNLVRRQGLGATRHVVAPEPTSAGRRGLKLRNTWQRQSSTQQGVEARGHRTHGSTGAHHGREARSGAIGHVEVPELTSIGMRGSEL
jgi:hypothetical protein